MANDRRLILFDFDGTITKKDTLFEFARFAVGESRFFAGLAALSLPMVMNRVKLLSAQLTKEVFIAHFFRNISADAFKKHCVRFAEERIPALIRPLALEAIVKYRQAGDRMIIVSASPKDWIEPWAATMGMEVIATRLVVNNGKLTGKIDGKNCNGLEKVARIKEHLVLTDYETIIAFGDTSGDLPMLALASEKNFRPFRTK